MRFSIHVLLIAVMLLPVTAVGQTADMLRAHRSYDALDFDYTSYIMPGKTGQNAKLNLLTSIAFNRIQFLKYDDEFRAQYEVTVELRDFNDELIHGKSWIEAVKTTDYEETDSYTMHHMTGIELPVTPGDYKLNVYIEDIETRKRVWRKDELTVPDYDDEKIRVSSIILIDKYRTEGERITGFSPIIQNTLENSGRDYYTYIEIFPDNPGQTFTVEAELRSLKKRNKFNIKFPKQENLKGDESIPVVFTIQSDKLPTGAYEIVYKIRSGRDKQEISRDFALSWFGIPTSEDDIELALNQMEYAFEEVEQADLDKLSFEEKANLFRKIWDARDPSPDTPLNEMQEEYFRRVRYANKYFTVFRDGWKTDRGLIYILFGPPNDIYRYEYNIDTKPFQTWTYYRENLIFQFFDRNGFGDYELTTPYNIDALGKPIR